jgi:hypothetical protein
LDVAVLLAQFYIAQARASGDLRFLGYAEAVLAPGVAESTPTPAPAALVLQATVQQSRHEFAAALRTLDRSLAVAPGNAQAWLTRATVLRVLGRYSEAQVACTEFARRADHGEVHIGVGGVDRRIAQIRVGDESLQIRFGEQRCEIVGRMPRQQEGLFLPKLREEPRRGQRLQELPEIEITGCHGFSLICPRLFARGYASNSHQPTE